MHSFMWGKKKGREEREKERRKDGFIFFFSICVAINLIKILLVMSKILYYNILLLFSKILFGFFSRKYNKYQYVKKKVNSL